MDDFFDDFDEGDSFEDSFDEDFEAENSLDDDSGIEGETTEDDIHNHEFTGQNAFFLGSAMGFAYEEGLEERKRRKLEKEMDSERDRQDREDDI
ncbi:MAG: hypothetical protein KAT52_09300 [Desulfobacterales bacterium]|nr:hypothetical protein [Desulfobacterales bacterium]